MAGARNSTILKGFQSEDFRRAVSAFIREKCGDLGDGDEMNLHAGLKIIRQFILRKREEREARIALAPGA